MSVPHRALSALGYRDSYSVFSEDPAALQGGFDRGYHDGIKAGLQAGRSLGFIAAREMLGGVSAPLLDPASSSSLSSSSSSSSSISSISSTSPGEAAPSVPSPLPPPPPPPPHPASRDLAKVLKASLLELLSRDAERPPAGSEGVASSFDDDCESDDGGGWWLEDGEEGGGTGGREGDGGEGGGGRDGDCEEEDGGARDFVKAVEDFVRERGFVDGPKE